MTCAILVLADSLYWARTVCGWLSGGLSAQQGFLTKQVVKLSDSFAVLNEIRKLSSIYAVFVCGF